MPTQTERSPVSTIFASKRINILYFCFVDKCNFFFTNHSSFQQLITNLYNDFQLNKHNLIKFNFNFINNNKEVSIIIVRALLITQMKFATVICAILVKTLK